MRAQWVCSRERRIALYKRSSINHQSWRWLQRRDWTWVVADHADSSHKTGSRGGRSSSTKSTTVVTTTTITTTNNNNTEATTGPAVTDWSGDSTITSQANPSSVSTERFRLQPRRLDPSSRLGAYRTTVTYSCSVIAFRVHASVPRPHEYYQCYTQWTDWQTTQRPIVQLTGDQGPARASSLNSQH